MDTKQKASLWLAIASIVATSLYPPWSEPLYTLNREDMQTISATVSKMEKEGETFQAIQRTVSVFFQQHGEPHFYRWFFRPPLKIDRVAHVDLSKLAVEWVIAIAISIGLYFAWPTVKRSQLKNFGYVAVLIVFVLCFLGFASDWLSKPHTKTDWAIAGAAAFLSLISLIWDSVKDGNRKSSP